MSYPHRGSAIQPNLNIVNTPISDTDQLFLGTIDINKKRLF